MGNKSAKELKREHAFSKAWERARTVPRRFEEDLSIPGIGLRRAQIVVIASFSPSFAWEIRNQSERLRLYRSSVIIDAPRGLKLLGYEELKIPTCELRLHLDQLWGMSLPVGPCLNGMAGTDGVGYELALFGDMHSRIRLEWWMEGPAQWRPLINVVMGMVEAFMALAVR